MTPKAASSLPTTTAAAVAMTAPHSSKKRSLPSWIRPCIVVILLVAILGWQTPTIGGEGGRCSSSYAKTPEPSSEESHGGSLAIVIVSLGTEAAKSILVERCHRSARTRGEFRGPVVVITDAPTGRYDSMITQDSANETYILPFDETLDVLPGMQIRRNMKRFRMRLLDYLDYDARLDEVDQVLYLDFDMILGDRVDALWEYYESELERDLQDGLYGHTDSYMYAFEDIGDKGDFHSGVLFLDRKRARHCMDLWRQEVESNTETFSDQISLQAVHDRFVNETSDLGPRCFVRSMEREPLTEDLGQSDLRFAANSTTGNTTFLLFPKEQDMRDNANATLLHITNTGRAKNVPMDVQNEYIGKLLELGQDETMESWGVSQVPYRTDKNS